MKAFTKTVTLIVLSLPLIGCDTFNGLWGGDPQSAPPPPSSNQHYRTNQYPVGARHGTRPVYRPTTNAAVNPGSQPVTQQNKADVTMVDQGKTSAPTPNSAKKAKGSNETPMVPGEAPAVE